MTTPLNVKHYGDFRSFLRTHFELKQKANPNFSLGVWSKRLGLSSTSTLAKILSGTRNPGDDIIQKLSQYFNFSIAEQEYFEDLIRLHKIKDDVRLRVLLMEKMGKEYPDASLTIIDDEKNEIIANWFYLCLREMTNLKDFEPQAEWIQKRLNYPVDENEIQIAIDILLSHSLIRKDEDGRLRPSNGLLHTTNDISSDAIKSYHAQTLQLAQLALHKTPVTEREITAETLTISTEKILEAKELVRSFKANFLKLMETHGGDQTYQLQIQLFPLTKELK